MARLNLRSISVLLGLFVLAACAAAAPFPPTVAPTQPPGATSSPVTATDASPTGAVTAIDTSPTAAVPLIIVAVETPTSFSVTPTAEGTATLAAVLTATLVSPTAAVIPPPSTARSVAPATVPATPTRAPVVPLTVNQIAATAIASAAGEQCVGAPPQPAKGFIGNLSRGKTLFTDRGCAACHGDLAQGNVGPRLAGTTLTFSAVIQQLRSPRGVMQRYLPSTQSDADECDVYIYVKNL